MPVSGTVFLGVHTVAGKEVAIKLEPAVTNKSNSNSPLRQESKIYKTLMGGAGVPWIMWSGRQGDYNVMVIDLLGPSLEDLFKMCNRHFSMKSVLLLADQLISRIEFIHSHSLLHRDIKPANFVMGTGKAAHMVNVIDFGLAKKFRDSKTSNHIPYKQDDYHGVGTSLFASINTHLGVVGLPEEFDVLYKYARGLEFDDLPDYEGLRNLFRGLAERMGVEYDNIFDWTVPKGPGNRHHRPGRSASEGRAAPSRRICEACNRRKEGSLGRQEWR
ncbi:hypothetical protein H0H93_007212 [Arthromyces matolae]|nr:hypothetical protein H0H93_007212 [Arthromyces matolae]